MSVCVGVQNKMPKTTRFPLLGDASFSRRITKKECKLGSTNLLNFLPFYQVHPPYTALALCSFNLVDCSQHGSNIEVFQIPSICTGATHILRCHLHVRCRISAVNSSTPTGGPEVVLFL